MPRPMVMGGGCEENRSTHSGTGVLKRHRRFTSDTQESQSPQKLEFKLPRDSMIFRHKDARSKTALISGALITLAVLLSPAFSLSARAQRLPWSQRVANSAMQRWPDGRIAAPDAEGSWNYELGLLLDGFSATWYNSADGDYYWYLKRAVDQFVARDGSISTYDSAAHSPDNIAAGRQLLLLYRVTGDEKYYKAALLLRKQLAMQPREASNGPKEINFDQMWLDDLSMAEPFYAEFAATFHEPEDFAHITEQFSLIEQRNRSPKTGLLYHARDESREQARADKATGDSHIFLAQGMGWYMMALVDALPYYPENDPGRVTLLAILNRTAAAVVRYQDNQTGLWYQVLDKPGAPGNYFESSAACMFAYALQKGVRLGYLSPDYSSNAEGAWRGILGHFVHTDANGGVHISGTVKGIGLGGNCYHDGSERRSVGSPAVTDDPTGVGAFLLASSEMELAPEAELARGDTVMLDAWFNSQQRHNAAGQEEYFHYKWNDLSDSGYSIFGHMVMSRGAKLETLYTAPTMDRLRAAQFYIIASPDIPAKNPHPHYVQPQDAKEIAQWVRQGGVLVLMENDPANADIEHLDLIADQFGIHFDSVLKHHIIGDQFGPGFISVDGHGPIFHHPHTLYMKDTCAISLKAPAISLLRDKEGIVIAEAKYGRGTAVAVVDPWLYNEYTDHRKVQPAQDNFAAGQEFVSWLLKQAPGRSGESQNHALQAEDERR